MAFLKPLTMFQRIIPSIAGFSSKFCASSFLRSQKAIIPSSFHYSTSKTNEILMEFFEEKKKWGSTDIQVGRAWKTDELRIKSNTDLHKLWYILLKERNMLLTMEEECNREVRLFPNPERIDKVEESMRNLETVVRERNIAYHTLETGSTGERPAKLTSNQLGYRYFYKTAEHVVPKWMNTHWARTRVHSYGGYAVRKFLVHFREKLYLQKRKQRNRDVNHVQGLFKRFPNLDVEALQKEYPNVDLKKARVSRRARGHFVEE